MTRIVHLSDLHFGRERPELVDTLVSRVNAIAPDLVVVSGDFTQRARRSQFENARRFLDRLEPDILSVPGNHDTPLDNLFIRMVTPWRRYRRAIDRNLQPDLVMDGAKVIGVNTVNRFSWQRGRIGNSSVRRVCNAFDDAGDRLRIVVLHHPLEHGPHVEKRLMRGAIEALERLEGCGADIVLSGHLHNTVTSPFAASPGLLFVQAGTGLSDRHRGDGNTFNLVSGTREEVTIETFAANATPDFVPEAIARFSRDDRGWHRVVE